jgi:hypothetical protein
MAWTSEPEKALPAIVVTMLGIVLCVFAYSDEYRIVVSALKSMFVVPFVVYAQFPGETKINLILWSLGFEFVTILTAFL